MTAIRHFLTVFKRELAAYFNSPIAYIFIIVFVLLNGGMFMTQFFLYGRADMRPFFGGLPFLLATFLPAISMRLWAEEKRGNTLELLLTFPMGTHVLVLGKFAASVVFYLVALLGTVAIPIMLQFLGSPDWGAISGGYLGAVFLGAFFLAVGIFVSGLCRDQIVAFIVAMMICFSLQLVGTEFVAASIDGWLPGIGTLLRRFIGCAPHFDSFGKGVIDNRDVLYFVIGIAIFLILNGFWLEGRMRPKAKSIFSTAVIISVGILFTSNWLFAEISLGRFDLTEGRIYTISDSSRKILSELKAPVSAKLYISPSDKMPTGMKTLEQDIRDKLDEMRVASKGHFNFKIFHMEAANIADPAAGAEQSLEGQLSEKGIHPFQVQSIEADEVGVKLAYSALTLSYKAKGDQIIPRVTPNNIHELEYLIMSRIYRMDLPEAPGVALVAPYEEKEMEPELREALSKLGAEIPAEYKDDNYELLPQALEYSGYEVTRIRLTKDEPIPDGVKTLIVAEPEELNERQRFEINQFLRGGGSVFLAVQNYDYKYSAIGRDLKIETESHNPQVNSLLRAWGFEVVEKILLDQQSDVISLAGAARIGPFEMSIPVKVPIQILIPSSGMNPELSITSRLNTLFYLWGSALKIDYNKTEQQGLKVDELLETSQESWTVPFKTGEITPADLEPVEDSEVGPFVTAIFARGQFADAFEGKATPDWPTSAAGSDEKSLEAKASGSEESEGKLILVGAATLLRNNLVKDGGHMNFFLNCVDALSLGEELVTIRSKRPIDRAIGRISSAKKVMWRFFVSFLIPLIFAVLGITRLFLRGQSKKNYLNALSEVTH